MRSPDSHVLSSHVAARVMYVAPPPVANGPRRTMRLMMISSSTVTSTIIIIIIIMAAQTPATRQVTRGPQISCHAANSAGLIG